jgi:hypothetical protein
MAVYSFVRVYKANVRPHVLPLPIRVRKLLPLGSNLAVSGDELADPTMRQFTAVRYAKSVLHSATGPSGEKQAATHRKLLLEINSGTLQFTGSAKVGTINASLLFLTMRSSSNNETANGKRSCTSVPTTWPAAC